MKRNIVLTTVMLFLILWLMPVNSPYQFQIVGTNEVPLGPVEFSHPAADTYQYIDARQSITYGTTAGDPPLGMGADDTTTTNMTEASYTETTYTQLEYASFSSTPSGWAVTQFTISGGLATSNNILNDRALTTKTYDLSSGYVGARLVYQHRAYDFENYLYEVSDWEIWTYTGSYAKYADVAAADVNGAWKNAEVSITSTYASFRWELRDGGADANEQIQTDNWYVYGIVETTYYRFEAVFRFDSVTLALGSYTLYIDFYSALTGNDDLDFYIGTSSNPTTLIGADKQDDFSVVVTSYITASTIYLKIADNYRSGDTSQTTAYIQRIYLYTPEETVSWYDDDWLYRKQISVVEQTGAGTNYQIQLTGYYNDSTKDVAGSVDFEALCQTDFDDIRFTAANGTTLLDYWLDTTTYVSATSATFWVEVKADVSSTASDVKIFVYFGNAAASSVSSGDATFLFFDDFENNNLNKWDSVGAYWSTTSAQYKSGSYSAWGDSGTTGASRYLYYYPDTDYTTDIMVHTWFRAQGAYGEYPIFGAESNTNSLYLFASPTDDWGTYRGTWAYYEENTQAAATWYRLELGIDFTNAYLRPYINGVHKTDQTLKDSANGAVADIDKIGSLTDGDAVNRDHWLDDYYIRKWQLTEPTFAAPSAIEVNDFEAPIIHDTGFSPLNPSTLTGVTLYAIATDRYGIESLYFDPVAYPDGFDDINYYATETGVNVWSYTFDAGDIPEGIYSFRAYAADTKHQTPAAYTQYQTFQVSIDRMICYIRIFDTLGEWIPFETFEVYRELLGSGSSARQYTDQFSSYSDQSWEIVVRDRWGEELNRTLFDPGTEEFVITVDIYSLKVQSWHSDYVFFNLTRSGITYTEVIAPLEIVNFRLYTNTYNWSVDYRNTTTITGSTALTGSTCIVITGNTIADVAGLTYSLLAMTTQINVTVTATNNYVLTISIDLDNVNTTINNQLIQVLLDISNTNSTVYSQTVDLLALLQNVNTTLFDQTVTILADIANLDSDIVAQTVTLLASIENMNSTLYFQTVDLLTMITNTNTTIMAQTITMLADIATLYSETVTQALNILLNITNVNSTIYSQTVSILSAISNMNSTIYTQTLTLIADIQNTNATLYAQTITLLANIANIDSDIVAQTVTLLSSISNVNSTLYSQTVTLLADISNMNSTLYNQTVSLMTTVININATLYNQTVSILVNILNINSTLYNQAVSLLAYIINHDTLIYAQTLSIISHINDVDAQIEVLQETADTIAKGQRGEQDLNTSNVTFVIVVVSIVLLSIFLGGIIMWWEKRKEKQQDFRMAVASGR